MEHQKVANLLNDESNKPSKFWTRNWVEINDESKGEYSYDKLIRFKTADLVYMITVMLIYLLKEI